MRTSSAITGLFIVAASVASAQYTNQSAPFALVINSDNATINGVTLAACHEGAAIEGLCLFGGPLSNNSVTYQQNVSSYPSPTTAAGLPGLLTYDLRGGNFNVSSAMMLSYNPTSNVAVPLFFPGTDVGTTLVAFDECGKMNIQGWLDDRTYPLTTMAGAPVPYYRWYACGTDAGYMYETLAWTMGEYPPENPSCQAVNVTRVFV